MKENKLFPKLEITIQSLSENALSEERKKILQPLVEYIQTRVDSQEEIRLCFICTHNSRRSYLSQLWAQAMAAYFKIHRVQCYSGGTESTAIFPIAAEAMKQAGFEINKLSEGNNPVYSSKFSANAHPLIGFSKSFNDAFNPVSNFAAIMTCSQADDTCPFIAGAEKRIPITYEDPKVFDGTSQQAEKYQETSLLIATEMFYVFSKITH